MQGGIKEKGNWCCMTITELFHVGKTLQQPQNQQVFEWIMKWKGLQSAV